MMRLSEEIQVIDDGLILSALTDDKEADFSASRLAEIVMEAKSLQLSYKKIGTIGNLQGFDALVKLCLDNNRIEKIENLEELVHLEWLDLSFNKIKKIQGLTSLKKLSDLSLFNNEICEIGQNEKDCGLFACVELQCLSLGNNKICALDSIIMLRRLKKLQLLNLEGNPISKESEYRAYILAYLSNLTYLDFSMVLKSEIVAAREQYQDELLDIEEKENLDQEKDTRHKLAIEQSNRLKEQNLHFVEFLFDQMFQADNEFHKFKLLPGILDLYQSFKSEVESASIAFLESGKAKHEQKRVAIDRFESNLQILRQQFTSKAIEQIEQFLRFKKHFLQQFFISIVENDQTEHIEGAHFHKDDDENIDLDLLCRNPREFFLDPHFENMHIDISQLQPIQDKLFDLYNSLMEDEIRQVEKFETLMNAFENDFSDLKNGALELQQTYFRAVEDHEAVYAKEVTQLVTDLLDKTTDNDDEHLLLPTSNDDFSSSDLSELLADRDTCLAAVTGSHDSHISKLFKIEDDAKNTEDNLCRDCIKAYRDFEHNRNRSRVLELVHFKDSLLTELRDIVAATTNENLPDDLDPE